MSSIVYKEKDDSISWEEIQQVIFLSHAINRSKGVDIRNAHLSPEELQKKIGNYGKCFVALDGEKVVGTCSVIFQTKNVWYANGRIAYMLLEAVLPGYKGQHIFRNLSEIRKKYTIGTGCLQFYMNVAEKNTVRRLIAKKENFVPVAIHFNNYNPHNYITYSYWVNKRPYSRLNIYAHYIFSLLKLYYNCFKRNL